MAEEEQSGEKVHEPTQQRLDDARKKGDIAVSKDIAAAAAYLGLLLAIGLAGAGVARSAGETLASVFSRADRLAPRLLDMGGPGLSLKLTAETLLGLSPLFVIPFVLVFIAILAQQAFVVAPEKVLPKLSRISPIAQAKQKFGPTGLAEFVKSASKLIIISLVLFFYMMGEQDRIIGLARLPAAAAPQEVARLTFGLLIRIVVIAMVIAAADYLWQRYDHRRKLRMTHQEMKEEVKRAEGDPQTKSQRRRRAEEIATNKMMHDVPNASVVIVNPTHYAVALRWRRHVDPAPVLVAKGVDEIALRIRRTAEEAGVPVHSDPPTARALEGSVEIGHEIDPRHYEAVAAAIRFAEAMRAKARERGG